jgi:hypothetical protein
LRRSANAAYRHAQNRMAGTFYQHQREWAQGPPIGNQPRNLRLAFSRRCGFQHGESLDRMTSRRRNIGVGATPYAPQRGGFIPSRPRARAVREPLAERLTLVRFQSRPPRIQGLHRTIPVKLDAFLRTPSLQLPEQGVVHAATSGAPSPRSTRGDRHVRRRRRRLRRESPAHSGPAARTARALPAGDGR